MEHRMQSARNRRDDQGVSWMLFNGATCLLISIFEVFLALNPCEPWLKRCLTKQISREVSASLVQIEWYWHKQMQSKRPVSALFLTLGPIPADWNSPGLFWWQYMLSFATSVCPKALLCIHITSLLYTQTLWHCPVSGSSKSKMRFCSQCPAQQRNHIVL